MTKLKIQADYCFGLFLPDGATGPDLLGFPPDLCARFDDWVKRYCEYDDAPPGFDRNAYNAEGRALAQEIQRAVGDRFEIKYRYLLPSNNPDANLEFGEEKMA